MDAKRRLDKKKLIRTAAKRKTASDTTHAASSITDVIDQGAIVKTLGDHINTRMKEIDFDDDLDDELFEERGRQLKEEASELQKTAQRNLQSAAEALLKKGNTFAVGHNRSSITCCTHIDDLVWYGDKSGAVYCYDIRRHDKNYLVPSVRGAVLSMAVSDTRGVRSNVAALERTTVDHSCPSYFAAGGADGLIHIWKTFSREYVGQLKLHRTGVTGLAFRLSTNTLYSCSEDSTLRVWSVAEMLSVDSLFGHTGPVLAIAASRKERAATGGYDRTMRYWKVEAGTQVEYAAQTAPVECVAFLNEETIVVGTAEGTLNVFDTGKMNPQCQVHEAHGAGNAGDGTGLERDAILSDQPQRGGTGKRNGNPIYAMAAPFGSNIVVTGSNDGYVRFWMFVPKKNPNNNNNKSAANKSIPDGGSSVAQLVPIGSIPADGIINGLSMSSDGRRLFVACAKEPRLGRWVTLGSALNRLLWVSANPKDITGTVGAVSSVMPVFAPRQADTPRRLASIQAAQARDDEEQEEEYEGEGENVDQEEEDGANDGLPEEDDMFVVGDNGQLIFKGSAPDSAKSSTKLKKETESKKGSKKIRLALKEGAPTGKKTSLMGKKKLGSSSKLLKSAAGGELKSKTKSLVKKRRASD